LSMTVHPRVILCINIIVNRKYFCEKQTKNNQALNVVSQFIAIYMTIVCQICCTGPDLDSSCVLKYQHTEVPCHRLT